MVGHRAAAPARVSVPGVVLHKHKHTHRLQIHNVTGIDWFCDADKNLQFVTLKKRQRVVVLNRRVNLKMDLPVVVG